MEEEVKPLRWRFTDDGRRSLVVATDYLDQRGTDVSERFYDKLTADLDILCQTIAEEIAQGGRPAALPDEEASIYLSRPTYRYRLETSKRRACRSSAGLWNVYYTLEANQGKVDTVAVVLIRHSGAAPLTVESPVGNDAENEE